MRSRKPAIVIYVITPLSVAIFSVFDYFFRRPVKHGCPCPAGIANSNRPKVGFWIFSSNGMFHICIIARNVFILTGINGLTFGHKLAIKNTLLFHKMHSLFLRKFSLLRSYISKQNIILKRPICTFPKVFDLFSHSICFLKRLLYKKYIIIAYDPESLF